MWKVKDISNVMVYFKEDNHSITRISVEKDFSDIYIQNGLKVENPDLCLEYGSKYSIEATDEEILHLRNYINSII